MIISKLLDLLNFYKPKKHPVTMTAEERIWFIHGRREQDKYFEARLPD